MKARGCRRNRVYLPLLRSRSVRGLLSCISAAPRSLQECYGRSGGRRITQAVRPSTQSGRMVPPLRRLSCRPTSKVRRASQTLLSVLTTSSIPSRIPGALRTPGAARRTFWSGALVASSVLSASQSASTTASSVPAAPVQRSTTGAWSDFVAHPAASTTRSTKQHGRVAAGCTMPRYSRGSSTR